MESLSTTIFQYLHAIWRRKWMTAFAAWAMLVGTCEFPGLAQWARLALRGDRHAGAKLRATLRGRLEGMRDWRETAA